MITLKANGRTSKCYRFYISFLARPCNLLSLVLVQYFPASALHLLGDAKASQIVGTHGLTATLNANIC